MFLRVHVSICFIGSFWLGEVSQTVRPEVDGQSARRGRSASVRRIVRFCGALLEVPEPFSDGPLLAREQYDSSLRMVHPGHCRLPKSFAP
jgi:hypothetical protein